MGYISTERVKEIRNQLKAEFPTIKFSVSREHHSTVVIAIMESSLNWSASYKDFNPYYLESEENNDLLKRILEIANSGVKYYETGDYGTQPSHYVRLSVGKWNKAHVKVAPKKSKIKAAVKRITTREQELEKAIAAAKEKMQVLEQQIAELKQQAKPEIDLTTMAFSMAYIKHYQN
jgi:hypothetical protein